MLQQRAITVGLAAVWGVFATWIFGWLFGPVAGALLIASEPSVKGLLHNGWTSEQIRPYLNGVITVLPALFYGLIFGLPLGFFAKPSLIVHWATFMVAFLLVLAARMLLAGYDIDGVLENVASAIYLLMFLATLFFVLVGKRTRSAYVNHRAAA
jgi:hypothetical protein